MRVFKALRAAANLNLANVQGDVCSRGFPKKYEIYYFFSINKQKKFPDAMGRLMSDPTKHISNLQEVKDDWKTIDDEKHATVKSIQNNTYALIGFSIWGLNKLSFSIESLISILTEAQIDCRRLRRRQRLIAQRLTNFRSGILQWYATARRGQSE